ncbi:hypothetical protein DNH61_16265 [Paenibacillus sambharensis]|uniref:Uncharacterized protein n=1 Tax=Paenibacillus sambharensis TaxID=1803190 RepID=A0A2W1LIR5_9BACL|nr:hypothetical protein [Paenibacillus sambharensis]PZD94785.1 hypothetical protein DNH61_16265 [Paenibacillus sambharensis]
MLESLFYFVFIYGIPALLLWSVILAAYQSRGRGKLRGIAEFVVAVWFYARLSFGTWVGLVSLLFGTAALVEGAFWGALFLLLFGGVMVVWFFPRRGVEE